MIHNDHAVGGALAYDQISGIRIIAVIVTHDRPALLRTALAAVTAQHPPPDEIIVVDNASPADTAGVLDDYPGLIHLRLEDNLGGAGGFHAGIECALERGADWLWLMDDDGRPAAADCLARLMRTARLSQAELVGALVIDADTPERLAFPIRVDGHTIFDAARAACHGTIKNFAHLFNGALVAATLVRRIGPPDSRFFIRGDEVEFLYRSRQAGAVIVLDTAAGFLHPGSHREIHPILGGLYYAVVPQTDVKCFYQFRNRGFIFRRYGMWGWLAADVVRYGLYFLVTSKGDVLGFWKWLNATGIGLRGRFMCAAEPTEPAVGFNIRRAGPVAGLTIRPN